MINGEKVIYFQKDYDSKERFCSYWHQIDEILSRKPQRILEVGIGNGFVAKYLKDKGSDVFTIDMIPALKPDIVASVKALPFLNGSFQVVACYEVLEHLPYREFKDSLIELTRISNHYVLLSLPDVTTVYRFNIELPKGIFFKKLIPHPFPRGNYHKYDGQHYWEIGRKGYPLKRIRSEIMSAGCKITKSYRVFENYYHRFFILEKQ